MVIYSCVFFFFLVLELKFGSHAFKTDAIPFEPCLHFFLLVLFFYVRSNLYFLVASDPLTTNKANRCIPPHPAYWLRWSLTNSFAWTGLEQPFPSQLELHVRTIALIYLCYSMHVVSFQKVPAFVLLSPFQSPAEVLSFCNFISASFLKNFSGVQH
jgi:hypothetical protein